MIKLTKYRFSDLYSMSSGISSSKEQAGHGAPFLSFSAVFNNYFVPDTLVDLMDASEKQQETYSIKEGDVFLTRTSEVVDELAMSSVAIKDYPCATYSGFLKRLRPKQSDLVYSKYLAFYLRSPIFRKTMTNNAVMTLRASLNEDIFSYLELLLPEYGEQKKIGDLLFAIDQKIKINHEINEQLEGMSKALYHHWFIQFDFPNKDGEPYKSSNGKMVFNESLSREVPEGWDVNPLSNWIEDDKTGDWGKETKQGNYTLQVDCIRGADIKGVNGLGKVAAPNRFILEKNAHKLLAPYDFVIEISGGSPTQSTGRISGITKSVLERFEHPVICSNFCKVISLKDSAYFFNFAYMWQWIYDHDILFGWEGKTSGIKNLLFDAFVTKQQVAKPPEELAKKFYNFVSPLHKQKQSLLRENSELEALRDWLIPMFMSGQVTVK
ncbi:restriction endonuclease subunit S [Shewanella frigidimarina]|uniref:restriction endonuclease subunit S n=1 Tax=Shewanella frigidimarina TaxID=56812 RepID=UPI003D7B3790